MSDRPTSYWRLGEKSGLTTADSSTGGDSGIMHGGVTMSMPGALARDPNTAMSFNGSTGNITVANKPNLDMSGDLTIEAWVKPAALDRRNHTVLHKGGPLFGAAYQYRLTLDYSGRWRGILGSRTLAFTVISNTIASPGKWTYLVLTRHGTVETLYVNGQQAGQRLGVIGSLNSSSNALAIGRLNGGSDYFNGSIDEVAIYNTALSASRILTHYRVGMGLR